LQEQQQQKQEVAADAMREGEKDGDGDDREQRGKQGEKRRRQDGTEEVSSDIHQSEGSDCSHNTNDEDVEDDEEPRPAKRPASSRCDNQPESRKSSSPSPTGDEEPTSNASAAYQEWPMRGFFKLISTALPCSISSAYVISRL
jgi:hypothetical protein